MRNVLLLAGLAALAACSRAPSSPSPPPAEPEVARPPWQLLVERVSRAGQRSFVAMTAERTFVSPVAGVPSDALRVAPSPDGRTLAVLRPQDGLVHLWLVDRTGENLRPLLAGAATVGGVSWSPDGTRLAVEVSTLDVTADVWVVSADGSGTTDLTPDPAPGVWYDRAPAWSPDGASIAFSSNRSGTTRLWVMGADGSAPRQVLPTSLAAAEHLPAWSADGATLAFVTETAEGAGIGVVRPDGTGHRLFPAPFDAADPVWLPDGRIAFSDRRTADLEVHLLDPGTGATTNLTRHPDHDLRASVLRYVAPPPWRGLAAPVRLPGRPAPAGLVATDLDADGVADVASLATATPEVRIYRGAGGGVLTPLGSLDASPTARAIAAGNVAGDGAGDLVILEADAIALHRGGAGGPGIAERASLLGPATGMALADLDRDGLLDVGVVVERPGSGFHLGV
jgi:dipeptidyl aminopeptidase/acylaminoacyl peptidase